MFVNKWAIYLQFTCFFLLFVNGIYNSWSIHGLAYRQWLWILNALGCLNVSA
jgi:hypothetical protein